MLYLVATPIGNLGDITLRAIETLKNCDYILCEDTRHSAILLNHLGIQNTLRSYHKFSEAKMAEAILQDLQAGKEIALISDAGSPAIADPGERLVAACRELGLPVISIPGPSAVIAAISASGFSTSPFQFVGFLPKKQGELQERLIEILEYPGTTVAYESPNRIEQTLAFIQTAAPMRKLAIFRELTKKFEEHLFGAAQCLLARCKEEPLRGELTLLIEGHAPNANEWEDLPLEKHLDILQKVYNLGPKQALKMAAAMRKQNRKEIYKKIHK